MENIAFALDIDDDWPPVATEHVWCEKAGTAYQLKNTPFSSKGSRSTTNFPLNRTR
jgi:hypothetical protein